MPGSRLPAASNNQLRGNSIHSNGGLGIDLGGDGLTQNDDLDADNGPNGLQNFPVIGAAIFGTVTSVDGYFNSAPNATFTFDFYASTPPAADYGVGERHLGSATATTDENGDVAFINGVPVSEAGVFHVDLAAETIAHEVISATATDSDGNTSEISGGFVPTGVSSLITGGGPGDDIIDLVTTVVNGQTFANIIVNGFRLGQLPWSPFSHRDHRAIRRRHIHHWARLRGPSAGTATGHRRLRARIRGQHDRPGPPLRWRGARF